MQAIPWMKTLDFKGSIYTSSALCVCVSIVQENPVLPWSAGKAAEVDTVTVVKSPMGVYGYTRSPSSLMFCLWPCLPAYASK